MPTYSFLSSILIWVYSLFVYIRCVQPMASRPYTVWISYKQTKELVILLKTL